jgi:nucleoside-diphosphate-sugar epimerase
MTHRALVFGATGYTGNALVPLFAQHPASEVWAHIRTGSPSRARVEPAFSKAGAHIEECAFDEAEIAALVAKVKPTVVFGLLGITRSGAAREEKRTGHRPDYEQVDYGYTHMVLEACREHAPKARFVYLSSTGISDKEPSNAYMHARWRMERALISSGQPWTIARPSFISGDNREESRPMERAAASVTKVLAGALKSVGISSVADAWAPMTNHELANALLESALDPAAEGQILQAEALRS